MDGPPTFTGNEPKPEIGKELQMICNKLGIPDRNLVAEMHITPTEVSIAYYTLNGDGQKHVQEDGLPAARWFRVKVTT